VIVAPAASVDAAASLAEPLASVSMPMMGGRIGVVVRPASADPAAHEAARRHATRVLRRMAAWSARLTRFSADSDLSRLNADPRVAVPVRPTLGALLDWGRAAEAATDGTVDIALLDARLAAEGIAPEGIGTEGAHIGLAAPTLAWGAASRAWSLDRRARGAVVVRPAGLRFDLDGVGKGWLADRAVRLLCRYPAALVDADGDIAIALTAGERWRIGIADGRAATTGAAATTGDAPSAHLATLELVGAAGPATTRFGVATSGTSVHRWERGGSVRHHLIDPATGQPAVTDVVQATVLAGSAREAEALAKSAVIVGSEAAFRLLDRPSVAGAVLLTARGELLAIPATTRWLA
jgi:thiamine biosynthesis lipoprotein